MKATIRIDSETTGEKRAVFWNDELSHHIIEEEIQNILKESAKNLWKSDSENGADIGTRLYRFLNGTGGRLQSAVRESRQKGDPLYLYLDIPYKLNALPFELMRDDRFLVLNEHPRTFVIRRVNTRNRLKQTTPEKRPLRVLFMVCSPVDLKARDVLRFEKEEELILSAVEKFPVDMIIEDSGSLEGLTDALYESEKYDILHITGHAGIDHELGPVLYMEDDTGRLDKVTPEMLRDAVKDFPPRVLFLSGCSTGKSDKAGESESFAFQMVDKGISLVLGWGLPVSDTGATRLTTELYRYFGMGKSICEAVNVSRQVMREYYHPWPLLRLFTDGSPLTPLIADSQPLRRWHSRKTTYKFLEDSYVKVLEKGFVGRRREIQKGVRVLNGIPGEHGMPKYGLLIRGPAGIGKSCLAGKLIERFKDPELIVIHGKLRAAELLQKLRRMFDRKRIASGTETLKSDLEFEDKIKELFRSAFSKLPVILCFDDFEQNLVRHGDIYEVNPDVIHVIRPILQALDWNGGSARLIISSRYPFEMEFDGEKLHEKLAEITLMSFRDADLEKKSAELPYINASKHKFLYMKFGCGNPRLLEWLEQIATDEDKYDIDVLEKALEGKNEEFIRDYLSDIISRTEGEEFHHFIHQAAVYRRPVDETAFEGFSGNAGFLEKGVNLTLFEKEHPRGHDAVYWAMPVIRDKQWANIDDAGQKQMHCAAYDWYDKKIGESEEPDYAYVEEAVYHGLESDNVRGACKHAIVLGEYLRGLLLYRDSVELQQSVADRITDEVIAASVNEKDGNIARLLNELGFSWGIIGEYQKQIDYYEKSLEIALKVYGDKHPEIAIRYNNIGAAWSDLGGVRKAAEYYEKALMIDLNVFGETHPNVARDYNNLGAAWSDLGDARKAIEYYEKAQNINLNVFGENHPYVAATYNNLGSAWRDLGDARKATEYYEKALVIDLNIFGENHPDVATDYNNLGSAWRDLGDARKAKEYIEKALAILTEVYSSDHPNTKIVRKNLEDV